MLVVLHRWCFMCLVNFYCSVTVEKSMSLMIQRSRYVTVYVLCSNLLAADTCDPLTLLSCHD